MGSQLVASDEQERRSRSCHFDGDARAAGRSAQERPGRQAGLPLPARLP